MNAFPVIERELRAEARHGATYWLRVLAAGTAISVCASILIGSRLSGGQLGNVIFSQLYLTFSYAVWVLVPLLTADCVSRERREGTLGLLFLTPLNVLDVIAGKATIHVLRSVTLFLAALPALGLPLVLGGVEWRWGLFSALALGNSALLAIGCGIYASCRGGSTIQVMVLSEACAWGLAFASFVWRRLIYSVGLFVASLLSRRLLLSIPLAMSATASWLVAAAALDLCFSAVVFVLLLRASIRRLKAATHDESPSPEQPRWVQTWTDMVSVSPLCQTIFNWDKSRTLDRNPVAWLQEYSWTARLTKWGWFGLALLAVLIELLGSDSQDVAFRHFLLTAALTLGLAFSAAGSFQREHQTGLLEQLLVTPLSVGQILGGRLWGIFGHYLPALAMLWFGWGGVQLLNPKFQANEVMIAMFPNPMIMVLLMITGLYFSLSRMNFFLAWGLTWVVGFVFPVIVMIALAGFGAVSKPDAFGIGLALQATLAAALWLLLQRKVRQRSFLLLHTSKP